jgi:prepilin-type processing-associated H-X9-DG protein
VRVAGSSEDVGAEAVALAFLDLGFADGHVERWLGPGTVGALSAEPGGMEELQR